MLHSLIVAPVGADVTSINEGVPVNRTIVANQELPLISKFLVLASIVPHNDSSHAITTKTSAAPTEMLRPF
jgi:hypothetical protein